MPLRLKNTTNTFSWTMANIFKEWTIQFLKVFVDNVNIHSGTWTKHLCHIWLVLQRLTNVNLKLNPSKCCFGSKSITFLGHIVDYIGFQLNPKKIIVVKNFPTPNTTTNVKAFLGLTRYCKRFIVGYVKIAKPLFTLTKKECKFLWTPMCQATFVALKMTRSQVTGVEPTWGFHKVKLQKVELGSTLPASNSRKG
jgi:hypothetical protein